MGFDQPVHWVVILVVAGLLFGGYKKLPEMARSAGRSMRIFKTEIKGMADDDEARSAAKVPATVQPAQAVQTAVPVAATPVPTVTPAPQATAPVSTSTVLPVAEPPAQPSV